MAIHDVDDRRLVSTWIEPHLFQRLDEAARDADRSRSAELRIAIREHLEREHNADTEERP